jgi:hypothetical protein
VFSSDYIANIITFVQQTEVQEVDSQQNFARVYFLVMNENILLKNYDVLVLSYYVVLLHDDG